MKALGVTRWGAIALLFCAQIITAIAVTFTSDTFIAATDFSEDSQDIVVTNCTLTVDGPHAFNSLQILKGAVLTHSAFTNGSEQLTSAVVGEAQTLSATAPATLNYTNIDTNTIVVRDSSASITYTQNVDYLVISSGQFTQLTLSTNSAIAEGTSVLVSYNWAQNFQGFNLVVSNDVQIAAGGFINVSGKGYAGGNGFGNGAGASQTNSTFAVGGGGGHAGNGGMSSTFAPGGAFYDSTTNPAILGSSGGTGSTNGGAGGGVAQLFVGGTLRLDGQILAKGFPGTNAHSGGGAGGSILLTAQNFSGAGTISARGGAGDAPDGGGGGGGCIAIYFGTNNFSGNIEAFGGSGANYGGAGAVYQQPIGGPVGQLLIANNGVRGTNTTFSATAISNLTISGGAIAQGQNSTFAVSNLFVGSNSSMVSLDSMPLSLTVIGDVTIESNASVNADFKSSSGFGAGKGDLTVCGAGSGGGYGGNGGASACGTAGGNSYGTITPAPPFGLGSPGGAAPSIPGGGAIKLTVSGTLSLAGNISANGGAAMAITSGGGSGGSVWLTVGTLSGDGTIFANGGSASNLVSGGGGGGRIAVYFNTNQFTGSITAYGGSGANAGGAGTIYCKTNSSPIAQLIVDNDGLIGLTPLPSSLSQLDLSVQGGATAGGNFTGPSSWTLRSLLVASNSLVNGFSIFLAATNALIQSSGGMTLNGSFGFGNIGQTVNSTGGGGGNGGYGGISASNAAGGAANSSDFTLFPAGGFGGSGVGGLGGHGGGILRLMVPGTLRLDGCISIDGVTSSNLNGGGGAGGTLQLIAGTFSGAGTISANGGPGNNVGGGGGGGRIVMNCQTNLFSGSITAQGGAGAQYGGAGFLYITNTDSGSGQQIMMDNGGNAGADTLLIRPSGIFDLTVTHGATLTNSVSTTLTNGNLYVGSNGVILPYQSAQQTLVVLTNATIEAGGAILDDAVILFGGGAGRTLNGTGGGGGNGGVGGASGAGAAGGNVAISGSFAGTFASPIYLGNGGGGGSAGIIGGLGGGSIRMIVNGALKLDGKISVDGGTGTDTNSGGGSGGSIWLNAGSISGAGNISADGGVANGTLGGGGAGGRIAVYYNTNTFTGTMIARGGLGANYGGPGTVYTSSSFSGTGPFTTLTVDNAGATGVCLIDTASNVTSVRFTGGTTIGYTNAIELFATPTFGNFFLGSNCVFLTGPYAQASVRTNATIEADGIMVATGQTKTSSPGTDGKPNVSVGGGGGHGGFGGKGVLNAFVASGGSVTDAITAPVFTGGNGGFGKFPPLNSGGGATKFIVNGTLQLDGSILANGSTDSSSTNSGGGAGGSIWLVAGKLQGTGNIAANGASGDHSGGGGGGGRIAIWSNTNLFSGRVTAFGSAGTNAGGAGTIYLNSSILGNGSSSQLIVDNGGTRGTNTGVFNAPNGVDVLITNGGMMSLGTNGNSFWNSLIISSNASLNLALNFTIMNLTINSNFDLQAGAAIVLDGQGSPFRTGPGTGSSGFNGVGGGGGAGHGGFGSAGTNASGAGGLSYDSITMPTMPGSGGGGVSAGSNSAGGGALQLTVNGSLNVNGVITVNGTSADATRMGGGSGGSLWLSAGTISGSGKISADGGNGSLADSGGGAGGRIAIYFSSNAFAGTISAHGGAGVGLSGGAGTIYLKTNSSSVGQLLLDNGSSAGTNTPLASLAQTVDLSIQNGAVADSSAPLTLQSLSIESGSGFAADSLIPLNLSVLGDALVSTNAAITADGKGYDGTFGVGSGGTDTSGNGSGAGYGGQGGASSLGAPGGNTYGSSNQPVDVGSGGGMSPAIAGLSTGAGAIRLAVNGTLTVNGNISANGNDGITNNAGGGSGGSIWLVAQKLSGNGVFTAGGGAGQSGVGGGGGGGRIAIYADTNLFSGNIIAAGGGGASPGQNGTIYVASNLLVSGSVTDTNGNAVAGINLQPTALVSVATDTNGNYSVAVPPIWTGTITPEGSVFIIPTARNYSNLASNAPNQNFLVASPSAFNISGSRFDGTNLSFNWYGINGVSYQPLYSSNLVNWLPYGPASIGSNAPVVLAFPVTNTPQLFFRLGVSY